MALNLIDGRRESWGSEGFLAEPGLAERLSGSLGFGDLFKSGFNPGDGLFDGTKASFSPELASKMGQYEMVRTKGKDGLIQNVVIDRSTGQPVYADKAYKPQSTLSSLAEGIGFVGGAALGGSWLASGALGGAGAAGSAAGGTAGSSAAGFLGEGVASGVGAWDAAAGLGGAGEVGAAAGGISSLGESMALSPSVAGNTAPLALSGTAPAAGSGALMAGIPAISGGGGVLDKIGSGLSNLTPAQQLQLAGLAGSTLVGALAPDGSVNTDKQAGAAGLQMDVAKQLQGLGTAQLGAAQQRQAQFDPQFQKIIDAALASQQTNDTRSAEVWKQYQDYLMPAQQRMAETAANFDTAGRRDAAGAEAVAGVDAQFQRNRESMQRDLGRAGVSLTSGRSLTLDAAQRFAQAKASAGADRVARQGIEDRGIALTQNVASAANPTASLGLSAAQLGLQAGNTGAGTAATQQSTYNASLTPAMNALTSANSAAGGAGNTLNGVANIDLAKNQQDNAGYAGLGSLLGQLGGLYFQSDPKTKNVNGKVSGKKALRTLEDADVVDYTYKPGMGDGGRHIGRMAGRNDIDTPRGKAIDVRSEFGMQHAAIKELSKTVKRLERRLSLADAEDARERA